MIEDEIMKKILITGANSYIGTSFENWLKQWPEDYQVDTMDLKDGSWKAKEFSGYDAVFHVAGIAHVDVKSSSAEQKALYYKVNRDLTIETAKKAKDDGVKQFVFMSSIIVYGDSAPIGKKRVITKDTPPSPSNFYGDSKLQAEEGILPLQSVDFNVVVVRPPMIYGKGSKGNYQLLSKIVKKIPIFPDVDNVRSMLYIDNLCEFIRFMILYNEKGVYFPQNSSYIKTSDMVKLMVQVSGRKIWIAKSLGILVKAVSLCPGHIGKLVTKAFGNIVYDISMSEYENGRYQLRDLEESISISEG